METVMDKDGLRKNNEKILGVEGKDEVYFFQKFFEHLRISNCEVVNFEGKSKFDVAIDSLTMRSGFRESNRVLGLIRDADTNAEDAFKSVSNLLNNFGFEPPTEMNTFGTGEKKVGIFIMPGGAEKGMLEDLCLRTVAETENMTCVNEFMNCVDTLHEQPKNKIKASLQAYLASLREDVHRLGIAAQKGIWDFDSPEFSEIRSFLEHFK